MGWFRDMLSGQQALHENQQRLDLLTADYNEMRRERQEAYDEQERLRATIREQDAVIARLNREVTNLTSLSQTYFAEKRLLATLLEDARKRELRHGELTERVITVERHNATAAAANEWAVAHINMLTAERASLLASRGTQVPVPELQYERGDAEQNTRYQRGAPAQPFDTLETPPPGPIATAPSIAGVPIPDGQTAGDVLQKLRDRREGENTAANLSPEELLRAGADIFSDLPFEPGPGSPTTSPFTE
jgi:hypothetical protein